MAVTANSLRDSTSWTPDYADVKPGRNDDVTTCRPTRSSSQLPRRDGGAEDGFSREWVPLRRHGDAGSRHGERRCRRPCVREVVVVLGGVNSRVGAQSRGALHSPRPAGMPGAMIGWTGLEDAIRRAAHALALMQQVADEAVTLAEGAAGVFVGFANDSS